MRNNKRVQSAETLEGRKELRRGCAWYEPSVAETLRSPEIAISFSLFSLSLTHFGGCLLGSSLFFRRWTTVMFVNCVFATDWGKRCRLILGLERPFYSYVFNASTTFNLSPNIGNDL